MVGGCSGKDALGWLVSDLQDWQCGDLPLRNSPNGQGERGGNAVGWMRKNTDINTRSKKST